MLLAISGVISLMTFAPKSASYVYRMVLLESEQESLIVLNAANIKSY